MSEAELVCMGCFHCQGTFLAIDGGVAMLFVSQQDSFWLQYMTQALSSLEEWKSALL